MTDPLISDDQHQCQTVVDKLVSFAKEHGSRQQYKEALGAYLPTSPIYDFLEGRIQHPSVTYLRLAEITESDEKERISKEVGERRTRLGAKVNQVVSEVTREVLANSKLESLYGKVINWTRDDDERRLYEEKLLTHAYNHLLALPASDKEQKRKQVTDLAHGMIIIKHALPLAWHIELEWHDAEDVAGLDRDVLLQYVSLFPSTGLAQVIQGFLGLKMHSENSESADRNGNDAAEAVALNNEERLLFLDVISLSLNPRPQSHADFVQDGLSDASESALAHRFVAQYYLDDEEYEGCVELSRTAMNLLQQESHNSGMILQQ